MAVLSVGKGIRGLPGEDALQVYKSLAVPSCQKQMWAVLSRYVPMGRSLPARASR